MDGQRTPSLRFGHAHIVRPLDAFSSLLTFWQYNNVFDNNNDGINTRDGGQVLVGFPLRHTCTRFSCFFLGREQCLELWYATSLSLLLNQAKRTEADQTKPFSGDPETATARKTASEPRNHTIIAEKPDQPQVEEKFSEETPDLGLYIQFHSDHLQKTTGKPGDLKPQRIEKGEMEGIW